MRILLIAVALVFVAVQAEAADTKCRYKQGSNFPVIPWIYQFDTGKAVIRPDDKHLNAEIAQRAKDTFAQQVCIIGYADPQGAEAKNKQLSMQRARAVAQALRQAGVPANKLVVEGRGPTGAGLLKFENQADRKVTVLFSN